MADIPVEYHNKDFVKTNSSDKWWAESKAPHEDLFGLVNYIQSNQKYRTVYNLRYARLYQNVEMLGFTTGSYARINTNNFTQNRLSLNVVKSCVDTAASKIAQAKPKPLFLTEDGNFSLKRKAKQLTQYIEGQFDEMKMYTVGQKVFTDACVFGTGAMKIYIDPGDKKIKAERVLIDEILVDDVEGMYGNPPNLYQRKFYNRDVLIGMFPDKEEKIRAAATALRGDVPSQSTADNVVVLEGWHLPTYCEDETDDDGVTTKKTDGKHVICIDQCVLFEEDYHKNHFPFVFLRWNDKLQGFWGMGLAEELIGIQLELNKTLKNIQLSQNLMSVPRIAIENSTNINPAHITNEFGSIIKYTGAPPQPMNWTAQTPEIYQWVDNLFNKAFEITGISRSTAQAQKPAGIDSAVAMREYQNIQSERFQLVGQRYEEMYIEASRQIVELSKELYADNPKLAIAAKSNKFLKKIKWKDVDMKEDQYSMDIYPTNMLPNTPAGKLQTIQELIQAGLIPQDQAISLLDFPDLDRFTSLATAAQDNIERMLEVMTEEGDYLSPEPYMNLQLALKLTQETYLRCRTEKLSEDRLELLRTFMEDIQTLLNPPPPPMDPMAAPPAMGPVGQGAPAPTSDLLPMQGSPLPPAMPQ